MKIRCEVLAVETTGDTLRVSWQGKASVSAEWQPVLKGTMEIPLTKVTPRTYHVGRAFSMVLEA